jgi:acyl carrier protein
MVDKEKVRALVLDALESVLGHRPGAQQLAPGDETPVYGAAGMLDSLELVNLVIELEQRLEDEFSAVVTLADERAVSQKQSPFRSVPSLVDLLVSRLDEVARAR